MDELHLRRNSRVNRRQLGLHLILRGARMNPKIHHLVIYHSDQTTRPPKSPGRGGGTRASNTEVAEEQLREQQSAKQTTESASVPERKESLIRGKPN